MPKPVAGKPAARPPPSTKAPAERLRLATVDACYAHDVPASVARWLPSARLKSRLPGHVAAALISRLGPPREGVS